jgi:uncharacterized membrane protein
MSPPARDLWSSKTLERSAVRLLLLSLCSAVAYGLSDFVGGLLTRRASVWAVAATSQATAAVLVVGLTTARVGQPRAGDLAWGVLAGLGSGAGNVFIYRGLGGGRMAVVAPLSAIAAAGLPALVGLLSGERPGILPVIGVLTAMPAAHHRRRGDLAVPGRHRTPRCDAAPGANRASAEGRACTRGHRHRAHRLGLIRRCEQAAAPAT